MIEKYNVNVSDEEIDLLKKKIKLTRWPDEINNNWSHGTDLSFLKEISNYWCNEFDWRFHENKINEIVDCSIISIHKFGVFVSIDSGIADALLPLRELPNDWYDFDQIKQTLIGERSCNKFNVGMQLKVKIVEVVPLTGSINVKLISN